MYIRTFSLNPNNAEALKDIINDKDNFEILQNFFDTISALPEKQRDQWAALLEPVFFAELTEATQSHSEEMFEDADCCDDERGSATKVH